MSAIDGSYHDGDSARAVTATMHFDGLDLVIQFQEGQLRVNPRDLAVSDRLGSTPRRIAWGTRATFVTRDNDSIDELLRGLNLESKSSWIDYLERRTSIALSAAVIAIAVVGLFAIYGVPAIAKFVAIQAPESISRQLAASTLTTIDQILDPTTLSEDRRGQLRTYLRKYGDVETIEFRKAGKLGANALTLSATTVVFTDEIVKLAEKDEQLLAVYLHELGHARLRHVEQTILQSSAWVVLFSVVLGDVSSAGELIISLPLVVGQAAYSRNLEREADQYAIEALQAAGISPDHLADALLLLQASHDDEPDLAEGEQSWSETVFEYLSTHPATQDRVQHIRDSTNQP